jgi:hypothetical protein
LFLSYELSAVSCDPGVGFSIEVVSKSQIVFQGKAQADEKAQHTR